MRLGSWCSAGNAGNEENQRFPSLPWKSFQDSHVPTEPMGPDGNGTHEENQRFPTWVWKSYGLPHYHRPLKNLELLNLDPRYSKI